MTGAFNAAVTRLPMVGRGGVVPYVVLWSDEQITELEVVERPGAGVAYPDESLADRYRRVLWERAILAPGHGRPRYTSLHPLRQRHAMARLLCQVCAQPADRDDKGVLRLLSDSQVEDPDWPDYAHTTQPPLCVACARASVAVCPWLRGGYLAVRAESWVSGVFGSVHRAAPGGRADAADPPRFVTFQSARIRWTLASQLVRTLYACRVVDLDRLGEPDEVARPADIHADHECQHRMDITQTVTKMSIDSPGR
jgi:hypothetical protein